MSLKKKMIVLQGFRDTCNPHAPPRTLKSALREASRNSEVDIDSDEDFWEFSGYLRTMKTEGLIEKKGGNRSNWQITRKGLHFLKEHEKEVDFL